MDYASSKSHTYVLQLSHIKVQNVMYSHYYDLRIGCVYSVYIIGRLTIMWKITCPYTNRDSINHTKWFKQYIDIGARW